MRILSYNISESEQWKIDRLFEISANVYVVPEITCPEQAKLPEGYDMAWQGITWKFRGIDKWKGLGIIWRKGEGVIPDWYNPNLYNAIPLVMGDTIILAFWPTKRKGLTYDKLYPQIAQEIIAEYAPHFKDKKVLVIGDYNCYVNQRDNSKEYGDILRINAILEGYGLHSAYHKTTGEEFGRESTTTYYHMFKESSPFFLDYAYTNMEVTSFNLLPWDSKMSDHIGQIIELNNNYLQYKNMGNRIWILTCNTSRYDIHKMFQEDGFCLWNQRRDFQVGDIVYIYETKPVRKITYKTVVEEINIDRRPIDGFYTRNFNKDFDCKLKLVAANNGNRLQFKELNEKFGISGMKLLNIPQITDENFISFAEEVFDGKVEDIPAPPTKEELYKPLMYGTMLEHIKHKMDFCEIRDSHLAKELSISAGTINRARNGEAIKTEYVLSILHALGFGFVEDEHPDKFVDTNEIADVIIDKIINSGVRATDIAATCNASISVISHFKNDKVLPKLDVFKMLLTHYNFKVVLKREYV